MYAERLSSSVSISRQELMPRAKSAVAMKAKHANKQMTKNFYIAIVSTIGLLLVCWTIANIFNRLVKKLPDGRVSRWWRKRLILPATHTHHSAAKSWGKFTMNIPTRLQTICLLVLLIENVCFLATGYSTTTAAENKHHEGPSAQVLRQVGSRSGIFVVVLMPFLWLFGGRNNLFLWATGQPLDAFNTLHKWIGRLIVGNLCVHGIVYTQSYILRGDGALTEKWHVGWFIWGNVAFLSGLFMFFQGMHYMRTLHYELFLYVHIFLALMFMIGAFWHTMSLGFVECVYATIAVWALDRVLRLARIAWSGFSRAKITRYGNVLRMDITYSNRWKYYPGCFGFIHFGAKSWQSHPFTFIKDKNNLQVFARVKDGVTQTLAELDSTAIAIDGPYGASHPVHKYDNVVFVAGGIGITGTFTYAQALAASDKDARFKFIWAVPTAHSIDWFADHLQTLQSDTRFDVQVWIRDPNPQETIDTTVTSSSSEEEMEKAEFVVSNGGDHSVAQAIADAISDANGSLAVLSCGPGAMNDEARLAVVKNMDRSDHRVDYFEESFSW